MIIALIILLLAVVAYFIISVLTDDPLPDDYNYCYNCNYGFCTETPKSKNCMKWQEELHDKRRSDFDKHDNICS